MTSSLGRKPLIVSRGKNSQKPKTGRLPLKLTVPVVPYESIRQWCNRYIGPEYARWLKKRQGRLGDTWQLDEVFIKIHGELHYLRWAVDQDRDNVDILVQKRRNKMAAKQYFRKLLKGQRQLPWRLITDKLKSYSAAHREVLPSVPHSRCRPWKAKRRPVVPGSREARLLTRRALAPEGKQGEHPTVTHSNAQYENNQAEVSHKPTRQRERQMRRFKSAGQAQRFLTVYGAVGNLFRLGRHLTRAIHYREFRSRAFCEWQEVSCVQIMA